MRLGWEFWQRGLGACRKCIFIFCLLIGAAGIGTTTFSTIAFSNNGTVLKAALDFPPLTDSCAQYLTAEGFTLQKGYVETTTVQQIERIYASTRLRSEEKAKKAWQLVFRDRVRFLPVEVRDELREILANIEVETAAKINGELKAQTSVIMQFPHELLYTEAFFMVLSHELEHAIQHLIVRDQANRFPALRYVYTHIQAEFDNHAERTFAREFGAMVAEYYYMRALPAYIRDEMVTTIERKPGYVCPTCETIHANFSRDFPSAEHFLQFQWNRGRYDMAAAEGLAEDFRDRVLRSGLLMLSDSFSRMY